MDPIYLSGLVSVNYAVPVFGYIVPPLAFFVLIINVLMVFILSRRHMRSPINSLLVGISTMDTLAIMLPVPLFINFFSMGNIYTVFPYSWCKAYFILMYVLPMTCNMASIWITVALACVRCYTVWRPLMAKTSLTPYRMNIVLTIIVLLSIGVYFPNYFEYNFIPMETSDSQKNTTTVACKVEKSYAHSSESFCAVHFWIQIVLSSHLPWFGMLFPDAGMLWGLKRAAIQRNYLLNGQSECNNDDRTEMELGKKMGRINQNTEIQKRHRKITWMIFMNVTLIWLVEIPFAVVFTQLLLRTNFDLMRNDIGTAAIIVILLKYVTYPVIFLTYCFMSQRFRQTFKDVVLCRSSSPGKMVLVKTDDSTRWTSSGHKDSTKSSRKISTQISTTKRRNSL